MVGQVGQFRIFVQTVANKLGYHIRRLDPGVVLEDPYTEQQRLVPPGAQVVFEVGAADGRDCVRYAELFPQAKIYAFEPTPESFAKLEEKSRQHPRIVPVKAAVSDVEGTAAFNISGWIQASSLLKYNSSGATFDKYSESKTQIEVPVVTIDAECRRRGIARINVLKMDAQGAEQKILNGAASILDGPGIDLIYAEVQFMDLYEGAAGFHEIMTYLVTKGFQLHNLYGLAHTHKGQLAWGDAIFVHKRILSDQSVS
jgi:FkbM family methyltransferase